MGGVAGLAALFAGKARAALAALAVMLLVSAVALGLFSMREKANSKAVGESPVRIETQLDLDEFPLVNGAGPGADIFLEYYEGKVAWSPRRTFAVWSGPDPATRQDCETYAERNDQQKETPVLNPSNGLRICLVTDKGNVYLLRVVDSNASSVTLQPRLYP